MSYHGSHLNISHLFAIFVVVDSFVLSFVDFDVSVQAVILVLTFFLVVLTYFLAVGAMFDSIDVVSLEILVLARKDTLAMLLILLEFTFKDLSFFILIGDLSSTMLHVVYKFTFINSIVDLQLSPAVFLSVSVFTFVVISVDTGEDTLSMELVALDATLIVCS